MTDTPTPQDKEQDWLDEILNKFGGLLLGNWQPRPGEEGLVYPVRLQNEAKAAIEAHTALTEVEARLDENNKKRQFYELMRTELVKYAEAAGYKTSTTIKAVDQVIAEIDLRLADLESQAALLREKS